MSLLGYTEEDVVHMANSLRITLIKLPPKTEEITRDGLMKAFHFVEGMLAEGRI